MARAKDLRSCISLAAPVAQASLQRAAQLGLPLARYLAILVHSDIHAPARERLASLPAELPSKYSRVPVPFSMARALHAAGKRRAQALQAPSFSAYAEALILADLRSQESGLYIHPTSGSTKPRL